MLTLNDRLYDEGEKMIQQNLNVFQILQSIDKLKVAVSILMEAIKDPQLKKKVQKIYIKQQILLRDEIHREDLELDQEMSQQSKWIEFFNRDERHFFNKY